MASQNAEKEKKSKSLEIAKNLVPGGERSLNQPPRNTGNLINSVQTNADADRTVNIIRAIISALLVCVTFMPWFGGEYDSIRLVDLIFSMFDDGLGSLAYGLYSYEQSVGASISSFLVAVTITLIFLMIGMNIINIIEQLNNDKSREKVNKIALVVSNVVAVVTFLITMLLKTELKGDYFDLSNLIRFQPGQFLTWGLILLEGWLIRKFSKNKSAQ